MPTYDYECRNCETRHEVWRRMADPDPPSCPSCGEPIGGGFSRVFRVDHVYARGEARTFGQQAEDNARRLGRDGLRGQEELERSRRKGFSGRLPRGATPRPTDPDAGRPWFRDGVAGTAPLDGPLDLSKVRDVAKYVATGETQ